MSTWRQLISDVALPRREAELLLLHSVSKDRAWLYAYGDLRAEQPAVDQFKRLAKRRLDGEPVAYILGEREFWSMTLSVNSAVLIPRPDTELLVTQALMRLPTSENYRALDLGTGSGAVALALASEWQTRLSPASDWQVTGVDISARALTVAVNNSKRLNLPVEWLVSDWFEGLPNRRWPLIVSNPPYIAEADPHLQIGDLPAEPLLALVSGQDGLAALRHIIATAPQHVLPDGWLLLEHGWDQGPAVRGLLQAAGFKRVVSYRDLSGHERVSEGYWP